MLNELFVKYKLIYDPTNPGSKSNDVYKHKHYTIITRQGIQKIEKGAGVTCKMKVVDSISTPDNVTMHGQGVSKEGNTYETFASASAETSTNKYYAEMAEKRCRSRLVLTLAGLYELGAFGEDEADSFSTTIKEQQAKEVPIIRQEVAAPTKSLYKGN